MFLFKKKPLAVAIATSLLTSGALAQTDNGDSEDRVQEEELVVTGYRSSVLNSIEAKRQADQVVEVIDAGDLGSLPDISIADALGRMPGVTTVRDSGQSSQLNIRGMNGDFIQTSLNGREQASTSGYSEGSRWISFDQYPSELITQAAVYKSPKASLIEGGVAGTVELKTANPLEADNDHNFKVNLRGSYNDAADNVGGDASGHRLSLSYQGKFFEDRVGINLGYALLDQPNVAEEGIVGPDDPPAWDNASDVDDNGSTELLPKGFKAMAANGVDERTGTLATVVVEPNEALTFQFDFFRSEFDSVDTKAGFVISGLQRFGSYDLTNPEVLDGFVVGGTADLTSFQGGPWIEMRSEDQSTSATTDSYGLRADWQISDAAKLSFDYSESSGEKTRLDRVGTMHAYDLVSDAAGTLTDWNERAGQGFTFRTRDGEVPQINFNSATDYTDLSYMRLSQWEQFPHEYTDDIESHKMDFTYDFDMNFLRSVEVGYRASERTFGAERSTFRYGRREGQSGAGGAIIEGCEFNQSPVLCRPQDISAYVTERSFGGSLSEYGNFLQIDLDAAGRAIFPDGSNVAVPTWDHNWTMIQSNSVTEKTFATYLMANLETEMAGIPVTGNIGVRVIKTDIKASGIQQLPDGQVGDTIADGNGVVRTDYQYVTSGPEFTDTLPSLNLNFQLTDNDQVRFALAKVIGRPPVSALRTGAGSWTDTANDGVSPRYNVWSQGNPNIDPFRANQLDISYEHYFEDAGAFTAAFFYKDIESLIENINYAEGDIAWSEIGLEAPEGFVEGQYNTVRNNDNGGYIRGIELAITRTFDNLPGVFAGLGASASYSYTESETTVSDASGIYGEQELPLPGLSENVWSASGFWDINNFSANLNVRYRDEYMFSGVSPGGAALQFADPYTVADMQMSYSFDSGIDLFFQVNNLTDESNSTNYGIGRATGEVKTFGRQYFFGVGYQF